MPSTAGPFGIICPVFLTNQDSCTITLSYAWAVWWSWGGGLEEPDHAELHSSKKLASKLRQTFNTLVFSLKSESWKLLSLQINDVVHQGWKAARGGHWLLKRPMRRSTKLMPLIQKIIPPEKTCARQKVPYKQKTCQHFGQDGIWIWILVLIIMTFAIQPSGLLANLF